MRGKLQKTTNFFQTDPDSDGFDDAVAGRICNAFATGAWKWSAEDFWHDQTSGKFIMKVPANMELKFETNRSDYTLTLNNIDQFARGHRFVYKLDAFTIDGGQPDKYLFTLVTPPTLSIADLYGQQDSLVITGRTRPRKGFEPGEILWVRRGAGEWRD